MNGNIEALQSLYIALGGSLTDTYDEIANGVPVRDYAIIPDMIEAISERAKSAGIELPAVTASDNGNVLGVVNGAWAKTTPTTYEPFVVEFTDDTGTGATCNHTFAEIRNAFVNGIISNIIYKCTVDNYYMQNGSCGCDSGETNSITFFFPQYLDNFSNPTSLNLYCVKIDSTNTVSETWKSVALS